MDPITLVQVRWREFDGKAAMTYVPRTDSDAPLYVRHTRHGWGVYHAASGISIRCGLKRDVAIRFLLAALPMADWTQTARQLVRGKPGLIAQLDAALDTARHEPAEDQ